MKKYILLLLSVVLGFSSCDDWLDVRSENMQKEQDQFSSYKGFRDALTGCYMEMAEERTYGQNLTMTYLECLANLWECPSESNAPAHYQLNHHNYAADGALSAIESMYAGLFNIIAQANVIIKHLEEGGEVITSTVYRSILMGEAYAIRAYCQLDVLRLFGQLPQGGTIQVKLPYSFCTGIDEMPDYYGYADYVKLLKADLTKAESLLKDNDPLFEYTFDNLNNASSKLLDDEYYYYRQSRLNYWAVKALQARMYLYIGETAEANRVAKEIIEAKNVDGNPVMDLSGLKDMPNKYYALPSECLFYLSKFNLLESASPLIGGDNGATVYFGAYHLTEAKLLQLYNSISYSTGSHNRYNNLWNRTAKNNSNINSPTLKKYWYDDDAENLMVKHQIIPMLRMSEVYLIAMETETNLSIANALYADYMRSCAVVNSISFDSLDDLKNEIINEYRREFLGEGQMFYVYKRNNMKEMLWHDDEIMEENYIVSLPLTEYNPNN